MGLPGLCVQMTGSRFDQRESVNFEVEKMVFALFGDEPRSCHLVIRQAVLKSSSPDSSFLLQQRLKQGFVMVFTGASRRYSLPLEAALRCSLTFLMKSQNNLI